MNGWLSEAIVFASRSKRVINSGLVVRLVSMTLIRYITVDGHLPRTVDRRHASLAEQTRDSVLPNWLSA